MFVLGVMLGQPERRWYPATALPGEQNGGQAGAGDWRAEMQNTDGAWRALSSSRGEWQASFASRHYVDTRPLPPHPYPFHEPAPEFRRFWSAPVLWRFSVPTRPKAAQSRRTPKRFATNEPEASRRFMVPMHAKKRKGAPHEPAPGFRRFWSAPVLWRFSVPARPKAAQSRRTPKRFATNEPEASRRFMVPMHAKKRKGAFHEPRRLRRLWVAKPYYVCVRAFGGDVVPFGRPFLHIS